MALAGLFLFLALPVLPVRHALWADTVVWRAEENKPGFSLDVPPEWEKDYEIKSNGVLFQVFRGEAVITLKSFSAATNYSVRYVLNKRAARLSGRFSTIYMVQEKIVDDKIEGVIVEWRLNLKGKEYTEKTLIYKKENQYIVLTCFAPSPLYEQNKVIFENALLSVKFVDRDPANDPGVKTFEIKNPEPIDLERDKKEAGPEETEKQDVETPENEVKSGEPETPEKDAGPEFQIVEPENKGGKSAKEEPTILKDSKRKKKQEDEESSSGKKVWKGYQKNN